MSFGGLFDGDSDLPYCSSCLSLGLLIFEALGFGDRRQQTNQEIHHQQTSRMMALIGGSDGDSFGRNREDENESRSGSGNFEGGSGDELEQEHNNRKRKKYNRHTPQQIQELENLFKECPHPDEKQRMELSKRLCLESRQVKFWFQNRRTQLKTQIERQENSILRHENDKLRAESVSIRDAMRNPTCNNCGGPAMLGEVSIQDQQLRIENARLKDELDRVCSLAGKFLGRPLSALASPLTPSLSYDFVGHSTPPFAGRGAMGPNLIGDFLSSPGMGSIVTPPPPPSMRSAERSIFLDLAIAAMDEMVKMAKLGEPLWISEGGREVVNYEEYLRSFPRCIGMKPVGYMSEASRETGMVIVNSSALVDALMDVNQWADMFRCEVSRAATADIISSGIGGSMNGALQLIKAEVQVLSPLVPVRELSFLRFCKQHTEGMWAVVDVSVDSLCEIMSSSATTTMRCRRLPSGLLIEEMPNGYSKVTWVEHTEYDESSVHQLYRPLLRSGVGLGATRWLAALQRQFDCLAILLSSSLPNPDPTGMTAAGRRSMVRLARRMTGSFGAGVSASSAHRWTLLTSESEAVRIMTRQNVDDPGEPSGVVLSAATSVWFPAVDPRRLFDFLRDARLRSEWDILSNGGPMQEMTHIAKGSDRGNAVSLLRATLDKSQWCVYGDESSAATVRSNNSMLILQETSTDSSGSLVTYAPVDIPAMHVVMAGGDPSYVALLPSGFAVAPDCSAPNNGSLLTVAFQILVNTLPNAKLSLESVDTVTGLLSCTVEKIKNALQID